MSRESKIVIFLVIVGILMIFSGVLIAIYDAAKESACYQLTPTEFYKNSECKNYYNSER